MSTNICTVRGKVIKGRQLGRKIGFPTANLALTSKLPYLEHGVYGVIVHWKEHRLPGVMNIGIRPTFHDGLQVSYEVHLFDFEQNLYNEELQVYICFFVRREISFKSVNELIRQIQNDASYVKKQFSLPIWAISS